VPDWITPDLGIGAVGGAIIGAVVAIYLDHRKRRDERRNRFLEDKQRAYSAYLRCSDIIFDDALLVATVKQILDRVESNGAPGNKEDLAKAQRAVDKMRDHYSKYGDEYYRAIDDLAMYGGKGTGTAVSKITHAINRLHAAIDNGQTDLSAFEAEYRHARFEVREHARRDLGVPA
jgi:hypothetical protein